MHSDLQLFLEGLFLILELYLLMISLSHSLVKSLSQFLVLFLHGVHVIHHLLLLLLEHLHCLLLALCEVLEKVFCSLS